MIRLSPPLKARAAWRWLVFFIGLPLTFSVAAAGEVKGISRATAFSDPAVGVSMTQEWQQRPIRYGRWAGKADLAVTLDQQIYAFLLPSVQAYARENGLNIQVREGTCGTSSGMLIRKQVDVAGFCCPPGMTDRLPGLRFHTLGIAAIAILVHPENPVEDLPLKTVRGIFRGDYFRWSEIPVAPGRKGAHRMIRTVGRLHCKLRPGHWRGILDNSDQFSPRLNEVGAIPDMIFGVLGSPEAIGYETLWHILRNVEKGRPKVIGIDGRSPHQVEALISGAYPLYRVFNVTTWAEEGVKNAHSEKLVAHLIREAVRLKPEYGLIPAARLRDAGWRFEGDELVGGPVRPGAESGPGRE